MKLQQVKLQQMSWTVARSASIAIYLFGLLTGVVVGLTAGATLPSLLVAEGEAVSRPMQFDMGSAVCFQSPQGSHA